MGTVFKKANVVVLLKLLFNLDDKKENITPIDSAKALYLVVFI